MIERVGGRQVDYLLSNDLGMAQADLRLEG